MVNGTDHYPIKNLLAWLKTLRQRDDYAARLYSVGPAVPAISYPFKGTYYQTQGFSTRHPGIDWALTTGTPLYAAHAGQVVKAGQDWTGYGWVVCIKSDALGLYSVYGHLNYRAGIVVRVGQWVEEREHIGYSDNTGNSTGPHLHFELRIPPYGYGGNCINPLPYLRVWGTEPTPPPPSQRASCWRNSPIIKKNNGKKVGLYRAGTVLETGRVVGDWTYVPGQHGQPDGFVKTGNLTKVL